MSEANIVLPHLTSNQLLILWLVLLSALVALGYGWYLVRVVMAASPGAKSMTDVADAVEEGAMAYLRRQVKTMVWFVIAIGIALFFMYRRVYPDNLPLAVGIAIAFLMGVSASYGAGFVGMKLAVKGNVRSANAALTSFKDAMEIAFKAGGVSGMFTVGLGLLGATIIFLYFQENAMKVLVGFGFGGSLAALFMRVGGGIYTKAADVGGDLVGKVEAGIPEDDPRNAATIADNVGDNVGDCAGMAADVFESYEVTLVAAIILAAYALSDKNFANLYGAAAGTFAMKLIIFALILRAVGVFSSILGILAVRVPAGTAMRDPMRPINIGYMTSAIASVIGFFIVNWLYLDDPRTGQPDWRFAWATTLGIVLAVVTLWLTNYFTHPERGPVTETAYAARTGPATLILSGFGEGLESSVWALVVIAACIAGAMVIFRESLALQFYGIALTGLGLLTTTGFILAMDTYGPITDNAHGIFEMGGIHQEEASRTLSWMDAIGNTTKALTKGLAIATAVIAAVSLFRSFIDEAHLGALGVQVNMPTVFIGLLIGGAVPFLFSSFAIKAVSRAAYQVVFEVRRQFREHPGIMEYKEKPDYARCVDIVTATAQKELLSPGILAVFAPLLVGFGLDAGALGGFLAGTILTGQLMAVLMANAGANWDNAKKKVEDGFLGGKNTDVHKATVVGDTVGDPFKDTAGPALNPMIKVMNLVGILAAPFTTVGVEFSWGRVGATVLSIILLAIAVALSKRGSIAEEQSQAGQAKAAA
ncbi:MAG TPA: sodium-translocating pyrophosphatase [Candidatus Binataceae bacterium]|jgi:K(+)-stimulated pyrophosphate-energized sodium pump|nr:sodium-translocating pyrophosphatase [Candidatus Binataceae bacterium]